MFEKAVFFRAAASVSSLPDTLNEVILSGRSNVGKSSIINALCSRRGLARTSKTPGSTKNINVYSISVGKWIVDLPGYGFTRRGGRKLHSSVIEEYIVRRKSKKIVYIVVDAFTGPSNLDFDMAGWLNASGISFKVIANKCDKVPKNITADEIRNKVADCFTAGEAKVFAVSAKKRDGIDKLKTDVIEFFGS